MSAVPESPIPAPAAPRSDVRREVVELVKMVGVFLVLFWLLKSFVVEGYEVQGPSMDPTIHDRERILVFKLPHQLSRLPLLRGFQPIQPGEIVVFDSGEEASKRYIKRVIAAAPPAGNGNTVAAEARATAHAPAVEVRYDHGAVYVNNRLIDEPYLQPEDRSSREVDSARLEPGEYYVLGDNRGESKDSRSFGPVGEDQVIGQAVLRFWPLGKFGFL